MTDEEAQRAFEQQTPVMFRWGSGWYGPHLIATNVDCRHPTPLGVRRWLLSCSRWTPACSLRPARPHELLTADEDTP